MAANRIAAPKQQTPLPAPQSDPSMPCRILLHRFESNKAANIFAPNISIEWMPVAEALFALFTYTLNDS